ncbi:hypothetical protein CXG81DRAFT_28808 [Caulochytrium protostelioides]|uniref:U3 small nucleolar ribonucleoprotein protein IMP3 n=1 Tax=Caulochytrium protostelioides TaxID=1555241 RepID=A0A4P9WXV3_9FUNG|nr:hypothetical protein CAUPRSCDRAFT_7025 [Caulochytrium protostelioides]RKO98351.1 hypothetical protein CXG81DRAFT_28808 [Caulochytrium protostelioides]|eukprot:RKO98351.1 hypothetical protein CXG81DRAFT_28808 [Caulochytrium protostelioides]
MPRQLKHHEQKLLRKVDFFQWNTDTSLHENKIMRRYGLEKREEYIGYNKLAGEVKHLCHAILALDPRDEKRAAVTDALLKKLHAMGLLSSTSHLSSAAALTVSSFCRRRLPIMMCRLRMAERVSEATSLIRQGHVRVGPHPVTDPAYLVTRQMEDYITWVDTSKIKRKVLKYNDQLDDFDLLE